jgi:hypothetical protein
MPGGLKLNVGCGYDYREGYVNIDGDGTLPKVDKVIDLTHETLCDHFGPGTPAGPVEHVLANDFIEHHTHWEAVGLLRQFHAVLAPAGTLRMKLPDFEAIITNPRWPIPQKIMMLFGGQDIPQGEADTSHRRKYPQYFCHKYAYTRASMTRELEQVGFDQVQTEPDHSNFIITARKPPA